MFIWRKVGPARRATQPSQKGDQARRVTLLAEPTFVSHVNGSPSFVTKCMKSWLAQGDSGSRVTLLPGTTFLHINGALGLCSEAHCQVWCQLEIHSFDPIFRYTFEIGNSSGGSFLIFLDQWVSVFYRVFLSKGYWIKIAVNC